MSRAGSRRSRAELLKPGDLGHDDPNPRLQTLPPNPSGRHFGGAVGARLENGPDPLSGNLIPQRPQSFAEWRLDDAESSTITHPAADARTSIRRLMPLKCRKRIESGEFFKPQCFAQATTASRVADVEFPTRLRWNLKLGFQIPLRSAPSEG